MHRHTNPDAKGKVELYWCIGTNDGFLVEIYLNRFEVATAPSGEDDPMEVIIPLKGNFRNEYALSDGQEAANKAFEAAHGLYKALSNIEYTALR